MIRTDDELAKVYDAGPMSYSDDHSAAGLRAVYELGKQDGAESPVVEYLLKANLPERITAEFKNQWGVMGEQLADALFQQALAADEGRQQYERLGVFAVAEQHAAAARAYVDASRRVRALFQGAPTPAPLENSTDPDDPASSRR